MKPKARILSAIWRIWRFLRVGSAITRIGSYLARDLYLTPRLLLSGGGLSPDLEGRVDLRAAVAGWEIMIIILVRMAIVFKNILLVQNSR